MSINNSPAQKPVEVLLRAGDIARRLSISRSSAYRLMRESLPAIRFGPGILRVREDDLEQLIINSRDDHTASIDVTGGRGA